MSFFEYTEDGHIVAEHNGRKAIDTRGPMLGLVPAGTISLAGYSITWPDLWKGTIYHQHRQDIYIGPPSPANKIGEDHGCSTWIGLIPQEWGPAQPSPNNLPDIVLGSVPAGTDYLEIWVNLTRTVAPAKMLDLALGTNFPEGVDVKLDGYSCVIEEFMGVARQFEFVRDGTTVKLRRHQSVNANGGVMNPPAPRLTGGATSGNKVFYFPGTNAPEAAGYTVYGQQIDSQLHRNAPTHRPAGYEAGSSNNSPCSMSHAGVSYASTWTGTIKIKPGRIGAP